MEVFNVFAVLTTLAALFSWVNYRYIGLPTSIGLMLIALLFSLGLVAMGSLGLGVETGLVRMFETIDFESALLKGMLGALLFAGALHVNLDDLLPQAFVIALLATVGVVLSTAIVAVLAFAAFGALGLEVSFGTCLLFGALISPTDPIAVLAMLKQAGIPKSLETKIAGESLFNDGIGVVVFAVLLGIVAGGEDFDPTHIAILLAEEALGGIVYGFALGTLAYQLLKRVDNYQVEILVTLAIVTGGYALAQVLHTSGPLAMVVAGLLVGNHGRSFAMSDGTRHRLDNFWELVDEFLNAILFVLIGLEVLVLSLRGDYVLAGLVAIPIILLARFLAVGTPLTLMRMGRSFSPHAVKMLTWGGVRGGISVALALSVPAASGRALLLTVTYVVVAFSIVVQGLSIGRVAKRFYAAEPSPDNPVH